MRLIGNLIWILMGGIIISAAWLFVGILFCITVVGVPFGVQCFKFAKLNLAPFGKDVNIRFSQHPIMNVIWLLLFGWEMAVAYFFAGLASCVTVIGIPFGLQAFKLMALALFPFGADVKKI